MIWRATKNALAGLLAGLAGGLLLGALAVIGWAAILSLVEGAGDWEHAGLYVVVSVLVFVLLPWVVQGLAQLQRSRIRAMLGTEIPVPARAAGAGRWLAGPWLDGRTWCQLGYHVLDIMQSIEESSSSGRHVDVQSRCRRPPLLPLEESLAQT